MDQFGPTGKVSEKLAHLVRWTSFPGWTGQNFGWMDRALYSRCFLSLPPPHLSIDPSLFCPQFSFPVVVSLTTKEKTHQKNASYAGYVLIWVSCLCMWPQGLQINLSCLDLSKIFCSYMYFDRGRDKIVGDVWYTPLTPGTFVWKGRAYPNLNVAQASSTLKERLP